jgi:hypothetical protein
VLGWCREAPDVRVPDKAGAMFKSQKPVIKHCTENLIRFVLVCTQDRCVCTVRSLTTSNPALTRSPNGVWTEYNGPDDPFLSVSGAPGRFGRDYFVSGVQAQSKTIIPANEAAARVGEYNLEEQFRFSA